MPSPAQIARRIDILDQAGSHWRPTERLARLDAVKRLSMPAKWENHSRIRVSYIEAEMKHTALRSAFHNYAYSFASQSGWRHGPDLYDIAGRSANSRLTTDFLTGAIDQPVPDEIGALFLFYSARFSSFLAGQGAALGEFRQAKAIYFSNATTEALQQERGFNLVIEDWRGRQSVTLYWANGARAKSAGSLAKTNNQFAAMHIA